MVKRPFNKARKSPPVHFFEALKDPLPMHGDPRRRPLLLLRIECWVRIVGVALSFLMIPLSAFFIDYIKDQVADSDPEIADAIGPIMMVAIVMGLVFGILVWLGFHFWLNWVASQIKQQKFGAKGALFGYGLTIAILAGLGVLAALVQTIQMLFLGNMAFIVWNLMGIPQSVAFLVFGILNAKSSQQQEFSNSLEDPPAWGAVA